MIFPDTPPGTSFPKIAPAIKPNIPPINNDHKKFSISFPSFIHISQLANDRVNKVEDVVKLGDEILVKVTEIDKQGRVNLSRKAMLNEDGSTKNEEK